MSTQYLIMFLSLPNKAQSKSLLNDTCLSQLNYPTPEGVNYRHPSARVSHPHTETRLVLHTNSQVTTSLKANSLSKQNKQDDKTLAQCWSHFKHTYPHCVHFNGSVKCSAAYMYTLCRPRLCLHVCYFPEQTLGWRRCLGQCMCLLSNLRQHTRICRLDYRGDSWALDFLPSQPFMEV